MRNDLIVFSGNSNHKLAEDICSHLGIKLGDALVSRFADHESRIEIRENVRGSDVFVIQSTSHPANENLMELMLIIDAIKRSSADRITAVIPYYGYARQERKVISRAPISAKVVADVLTAAGVNRMLSIELHTGAIQGFFNVPYDHIYSKPVFVEYFNGKTDNLILVSPDAGGVERARGFAKYFNLDIAIVDKRRDRPNEAKVMNVVGDVEGKNVLLYDDIIDTAGSIVQAAEVLKNHGALTVCAACTHGVLSKNAIEKINSSVLTEVVITDTIDNSNKVKNTDKIKVLSVSKLLGEAIRRIHNSDSVSNLFV